MNITDEQLRALVALDPRNPKLLSELKFRTRQALLRKLPNPTGVCPHGRHIEWDHKGVYSSGYPMGCDICKFGDYKQIVNHPPTGERKRLLDLLEALK